MIYLSYYELVRNMEHAGLNPMPGRLTCAGQAVAPPVTNRLGKPYRCTVCGATGMTLINFVNAEGTELAIFSRCPACANCDHV